MPFGLGLSHSVADADHGIVVAQGFATTGGDSAGLVLSAPLTKRINTQWAAGQNAGGLASALVAVAPLTWYHVFIVCRPSGAAEVGFDTALDAVNLLVDVGGEVGAYRRLGSVATDANANIIGFVQRGVQFWWATPVLDIDVSNQGVADVVRTLSVPLGVSAVAHLLGDHSANSTVRIRPVGAVEGAWLVPGIELGGLVSWITNVLTNAFSQVWSDADAEDTTLQITTYGWDDVQLKN